MKIKLIILSLCFAAIGIGAPATRAQTAATPQKSVGAQKSSYDELAAKLKAGDANVDYRALRMAFAKTKNYSYGGLDREEKQKMFKPLGEKNYKSALKEAEKILDKNFAEPNAAYVAFAASKELGDARKADFYQAVLSGLIKSITNGGDGKSAKSSFEVITTDEEYFMMNYLGFAVSQQSLNSEAGHRFDVLSGTNRKTNETGKIYFNIDVVWAAESEIFGK